MKTCPGLGQTKKDGKGQGERCGWDLTVLRWHHGTMKGPLLGPVGPSVSARTSPVVGAVVGAAFWPLSWPPREEGVTWGQQRGESQAWFAFHFCPVFAAHGASSFEKPSRLDRATGLNWLKFLEHLLCASALHTSFEIFSLFLYSYYAITANAGKFPL